MSPELQGGVSGRPTVGTPDRESTIPRGGILGGRINFEEGKQMTTKQEQLDKIFGKIRKMALLPTEDM